MADGLGLRLICLMLGVGNEDEGWVAAFADRARDALKSMGETGEIGDTGEADE